RRWTSPRTGERSLRALDGRWKAIVPPGETITKPFPGEVGPEVSSCSTDAPTSSDQFELDGVGVDEVSPDGKYSPVRSPKRKNKASPERKAKKRPVGRPPARTLTELGKWLAREGVTRADFAQKLQIERKSVDR